MSGGRQVTSAPWTAAMKSCAVSALLLKASIM